MFQCGNNSQFTSSVIKEGPLRLWMPQKSKWQEVYCKLQQSGWFHWFHKKDAKKPVDGVDLKVVAAFFAYGSMTRTLALRPVGIMESDYERSFAVTKEPELSSEICFFLCANMPEMNSWITSIFMMLGQPVPLEYQVSAPGVAYNSRTQMGDNPHFPMSIPSAVPVVLVRSLPSASSPTPGSPSQLQPKLSPTAVQTSCMVANPSLATNGIYRLVPSGSHNISPTAPSTMQSTLIPVLAQPMLLQPIPQSQTVAFIQSSGADLKAHLTPVSEDISTSKDPKDRGRSTQKALLKQPERKTPSEINNESSPPNRVGAENGLFRRAE